MLSRAVQIASRKSSSPFTTSSARFGLAGRALGQQQLRTYKQLSTGNDARKKMLAGVEKLSDAVKATMGPKGRNVIIEQSWGSHKITKDGVTVAKAIELQDKLENIGAKVLQEVATKSNETAGDGTTSATVLAKSIANDVIKNCVAGRNPIHIRNGIMKAGEICENELKKVSKTVDNQDFLQNVATVSANGDAVLGDLIATAFTMSKRNGAISVKDGKTIKDSVEHVQGMNFDKGWVSPYFATSKKGDKAEFKDCYVLYSESKISTIKQILPALEISHKNSKPLLIIAEDVDNEPNSMLILNKIRAQLQVCAVKAPGFGDNKKAMLEDMAIATGGKVFGDSAGLNKIENVTEQDLGVVSEVTVTKDDFLMIGGRGSETSIDSRVQQLKSQIEDSESTYDIEKLQERVAKLSDGAAIIYVGGNSEMEVGEKKDRITDAISATKAAIEMGVVPGGGVALLRCNNLLNDIPQDLSADEAIGFKIVQRSLSLPLQTLIENAGIDPEEIVNRVQDAGSSNPNMGYNVATGQIEDMFDSGVIDPTKVVISSLQSALHVASLLGTAEVVIHEVKEKDEKQGGMGDVGAAGGMMGY